MKVRIGLVVPALELGGGIPSAAEFVHQTIESTGTFDIQVVSLSTSARDEIGVAVTRPRSWLLGVRKRPDIWRGRRMIRVGTLVSELEFQRYKRRPALTALVADLDILQVVCGSPAWALSVCGLGKPVAVLCATRAIVERRRRDATSRGPAAVWRRWMTHITDRLDRRSLETVDAVQVMNPWMLDYARMVNEGRAVSVRYAPPGVDARRFRPALSRGLGPGSYVLCVGRLDDPRKNVELLLEAYAAMPRYLIETTRLVLAGSTGPNRAFWARVKDLRLEGRVVFISSPGCDDLVRLYQGASVFALSSDEEGFGMVVLEAMACAVPVVCTRSGGPDGIIADGKDGFLVCRDDRGALADRLGRLLSDEDLNRRMGEAARETILKRYELEVAGRPFLDTYDDLLARHR